MATTSLLRHAGWTGPQRTSDEFPEIDGESAGIARLKRDMRCVARDPDVTVLVTGESGTGKERVARAIHRASPRASAPFLAVDCAALSATLAEDALFGHVRGAFTGAFDERAGPFERAHGGTIFLDEIGDLAVELQTKLLRALQSRSVLRLGSTREVAFDVRVMAATHVDLARARERGTFREDLFYRLSVFELEVPALRDRGAADIRALTAAIVRRLAERRRIAVPSIEAAAMDRLIEHTWPGNVRELENTLERMLVAASGGGVLSTRHLPGGFGALPGGRAPVTAPPTRERIAEALERSGFKPGLAAAGLGLSRHQLYRLVKRYGIVCRGRDPWRRPTP